ncbi:MAG TPA: integrase family protein, partial [Gemmatimonadaceae bacterium]|nr:integrase family protein [Gemmatimonadaceae bacterium]
MAVKITKRLVDGLRVDGGRTLLFDTELPGFGIRATSRGKMFFVQYRAGVGRSAPKRRMSLGRYGPLTVDQARQLARETLGAVARGGDPAADRDAAKDAPTVAQLGVDFLADVRDRRKASTATEYARMWNRNVLPSLGPRRVADVAPADVVRLHRSLRKTPYGANRVLALLGSFFAFAELHGMRAKHTNPAHQVEPYKEHSRERFLTPEEIVRLGDALNTALRTGLPPAPMRRKKRKTGPTAKHRPKSADKLVPANPFAVAAIRFLLLTGWREREALTLRWTNLNLERGQAALPD